ncbi:MAG: PIG-L deacetylase family protein [Patescibacteria group bacterium]
MGKEVRNEAHSGFGFDRRPCGGFGVVHRPLNQIANLSREEKIYIMNTINKILCIGAHPDDIELACVGSLLKLKAQYNCKIHYVVCTNGELKKAGGTRKFEQKTVCEKLGVSSIKFLGFPDSHLHLYLNDLIREIEIISDKVNPNLVFTHTNLDHHQDHLAVFQSTVAALRNMSVGAIILYPSANHRKSVETNLVIDISDFFTKKQEVLDLFKSQRNNWYLTPTFVSNFASSMGIQFGFRYAEGFQIFSATW